jgi:hypothetical protein
MIAQIIVWNAKVLQRSVQSVLMVFSNTIINARKNVPRVLQSLILYKVNALIAKPLAAPVPKKPVHALVVLMDTTYLTINV